MATEVERNAIFISHASPQDNAFTIWLGARLSAAGYDVWADVLRLRGGDDWQRILEDALRHRTRKVLFVGTPDGANKQGVRNEIQIASDVSRDIGDKNFIIPLRLKKFEAPFPIVHAQYIDFERGWADGLTELLGTLESHGARPSAPASATLEHWRAVHLRDAQGVTARPEQLVSNWLRISALPTVLRFYDMKVGVAVPAAEAALVHAKIPIVPYRTGFISCGKPNEITDVHPRDFPFSLKNEADYADVQEKGWRDLGLKRLDASNKTSDLLRRGIEANLVAKGLRRLDRPERSPLFWPTRKLAPAEMISFGWGDIAKGRRQIVGRSEKREFYWHYAVEVRPRLRPIPHVRVGAHIIFTTDGVTPVPESRNPHRLRRSYCRSWRNAKWRDMMLAFLHWLGDGAQELEIPLAPGSTMRLALPPIMMEFPFTPSRDVTEEIEDDVEGEEEIEEEDGEELDEPDEDDDQEVGL